MAIRDQERTGYTYGRIEALGRADIRADYNGVSEAWGDVVFVTLSHPKHETEWSELGVPLAVLLLGAWLGARVWLRCADAEVRMSVNEWVRDVKSN
jgi:hypothetical protein